MAPGTRAMLLAAPLRSGPGGRVLPRVPMSHGPTASVLSSEAGTSPWGRFGFHFEHQPTLDEWGHMGSKKQKRAIEKSSSKQQEKEKSLSALRRQLAGTEKVLAKAKNRADRWRKEAKAQKRSASRALARAEKLHHKLDGASAVKPTPAAGPREVMTPGRPAAEPTIADPVTVPDETWSVVQLRAEARARGLTGLSNKTKAQLLTALA